VVRKSSGTKNAPTKTLALNRNTETKKM